MEELYWLWPRRGFSFAHAHLLTTRCHFFSIPRWGNRYSWENVSLRFTHKRDSWLQILAPLYELQSCFLAIWRKSIFFIKKVKTLCGDTIYKIIFWVVHVISSEKNWQLLDVSISMLFKKKLILKKFKNPKRKSQSYLTACNHKYQPPCGKISNVDMDFTVLWHYL